MNELINYFKENQTLTLIILCVLVTSIAAIIVMIIAKMAVRKKRLLSEEIRKAADAMSEMSHDDSQNHLFLDPKLNEETRRDNEEAELALKNSMQASSENENTACDEDLSDINSADENESDNEVKTDYENADDDAADTDKAELSADDLNDEADDTSPSAENETDNAENESVAKKDEVVKDNSEKAATSDKKQLPSVKTEKNTSAQKADRKPSAQKYYPKKRNESNVERSAKYSGKWLIYTENGKYAANLVASNGEILLRSELYTALSGVKSGIETIKNNVAKDNFAISVDKNGNYFFKLYSSSTRLLCVSEGYSTKAVCESAIESVKRFSKTAAIEIKKEEN